MQERVDAAGAIAGFSALKAAGAKDLKLEDVWPDWTKAGENVGPKKEQSDDDIIAVLKRLMAPKKKKGRRGKRT